MNLSQTEAYRNAAAQERSEAERSTLRLVRQRHLRSAKAWDAMASQGEMTERLAQRMPRTGSNNPISDGRRLRVRRRSLSSRHWRGSRTRNVKKYEEQPHNLRHDQ